MFGGLGTSIMRKNLTAADKEHREKHCTNGAVMVAKVEIGVINLEVKKLRVDTSRHGQPGAKASRAPPSFDVC